MPLIPNHFLVRLAYACHCVKKMPREGDDRLLELPEVCRIDNFAAMDEKKNFADVRLAWNEFGLGVQVEVRGKQEAPKGDSARPRSSDGVSLWIDTRDARTSHRASRYCHLFHFLPAGGGPEGDEPAFVQSKINRALHDAPNAPAGAVPFRFTSIQGGYILEAFLPEAALHGFDPEQNPRLGLFYSVRDAEHGEQTLGLGPDFPFWEDPSLWSVLRLERSK
jgi:hypothetical protein